MKLSTRSGATVTNALSVHQAPGQPALQAATMHATANTPLFTVAAMVMLGTWAAGLIVDSVSNVDIDENLSGTVGDYFKLRCGISDITGKVRWEKDGRPLSTTDAEENDRMFHNRENDLLVLESRMSDNGVYTCTDDSGEFYRTLVVIRDNDNQDGCGMQVVNARRRIFGGNRSRKAEWPWMVLLNSTTAPSHALCGGTLLNHRWVVTAAHCIEGLSATSDSLRVFLGKINRKVVERKEVMSFADEIIIHPNYDNTTFDSDIALIRLGEPVEYNNYISPICLPSASSAKEWMRIREAGLVTGWGRTENGSSSDFLRKVKLRITDRAECEASYSVSHVTCNMFCADSPQRNKDSCFGDSGGQFSVQIDRRWHLLGLVSWGAGQCASKWPGVYTAIYRFNKWIHEHINSDGDVRNGIDVSTEMGGETCDIQRKIKLTKESERPDLQSIVNNITSSISAEDCGLRENYRNRFTMEKWPWLASIHYTVNGNRYFQGCDGVLISHSFVLLSARCYRFYQTLPTQSRLRVILGRERIDQPSKDERVYEVSEHFVDGQKRTGLALFRLNESVVFTDTIRPVCIPKSDFAASQLSPGTYGYVTGWRLYDGEESIQKIPFRVSVARDCKYRLNAHPLDVFCATSRLIKRHLDFCSNIDGPPLVQQVAGRWYVMGIANTNHCYKKFVFFTSIYAHIDWIKDITSSHDVTA